MAAVAANSANSSTTATRQATNDIPQWKKDLIARLRNQNKKSEERLWIDHHPPHHHTMPTHHPHPRTDLVCPMSPENGFGKGLDSTGSSDSEDLHYGPGIVNRLRNKYLSLALRESNTRPSILRKATSLENLLDDDGGDEGEKEDLRLFTRRSGPNDGGSRYRSSNRRQDMKRARSVEVISRTNHEAELTMTTSVTEKINNRQSLHEDMLIQNNEEKGVLIENTRPYKKQVSIENGSEDTDKYSRRINRPKRIPPLLNEREKPPVDVVKHAKMIFEKRPETRTRQPHPTGEVASKINSFNSMIVKTKLASKHPWKRVKHVKPPSNGDVAAKVDSFNDIIVKTKVALKSTKPTIKTQKPVLNDRPKSNTHHHVRPVAKPVILSEEMVRPKKLGLRSPGQDRKESNSLPSPIPDVSRVEIKHQDGSDPRNNSLTSLSETPDLILTSSPIPKITSPTYRKRSSEHFIKEERNRSLLAHTEATNKFISPNHSPTKPPNKSSSLNFNRDDLDSLGFKMISPISQNNITQSSGTSVFNFINAPVDQRHLPPTKSRKTGQKSPELNGLSNGNKIKMGLSTFEIQKNLRNAAKSGIDTSREETIKSVSPSSDRNEDGTSEGELIEMESTNAIDTNRSWQHLGNSVEKTSSIFENLSKNNSDSFESVCKSDKTVSEQSGSAEATSDDKIEQLDLENTTDKIIDKKTDVHVVVDRNVSKPVDVKCASANSVVFSVDSEEKSVKIVLPKKTKPRQEESTSTVFNFTSRMDVPDYIANDTSRTSSRPVIPGPDEPGIKLLPEALLANFKEIQDIWEEDELIRSLEARPPSPCDVTFVNDNILIDGKSSLLQQTTKRIKLKISFVDDAEIYEYPSETSMLLEESHLSTLGGSAQVGHTVPTLSGSSLATYTPKTTEDFQLGVTKSFQELPATPKPDGDAQTDPSPSDTVVEEFDKPVLFSSGGTSDILF